MRKSYKKNRKREPGASRKHTLDTAEKKLFYILMYMKTYPTFDLAGFLWGVNRSQTKRWPNELREKLEKALGKAMVLPERKVHSIVEFVQRFPQVKKIIIDGTERPIRRRKDKNKQKECYSGKKKRHTQKNTVIASPKKEILVLSPTSNGSEHNYTLLKMKGLLESISHDVVCYFDLGFVSVEKDYKLKSCLPYKKPRNREVTTQQKEFNKKLSCFRVRIENALAGVKLFLCISDICRNKTEELKDHLMFLACELWNFHLKVA
jgi:hypothetical protein